MEAAIMRPKNKKNSWNGLRRRWVELRRRKRQRTRRLEFESLGIRDYLAADFSAAFGNNDALVLDRFAEDLAYRDPAVADISHLIAHRSSADNSWANAEAARPAELRQ